MKIQVFHHNHLQPPPATSSHLQPTRYRLDSLLRFDALDTGQHQSVGLITGVAMVLPDKLIVGSAYTILWEILPGRFSKTFRNTQVFAVPIFFEPHPFFYE